VEKRELEYWLAHGERHRLEVALARSKLQVEMAEANLESRSVRSPLSGVVVKIHLREGQSCETNEPLLQIVDNSRCVFVCNIHEEVASYRTGQPVNLTIQNGPTHLEIRATMTFVSPMVDPASSLMRIKAEFPNPEGRIRPGVPGALKVECTGS